MVDVERVRAAFPAWLGPEVERVARVLPEARWDWAGAYVVDVVGERVVVPYRVYHPELTERGVAALGARERRILDCVYTRHHDGYVRQRHCERLLVDTEAWAVPYVVRLVGEYVREILDAMVERLPERLPSVYGEFVARNPEFFGRTERRVVSYWSEYHRWRWPSFAAYPGYVLLERLREAAGPYLVAPLPRRTPR